MAEAFEDAFGREVADIIREHVQPLRKENMELRRRIEQLEAKLEAIGEVKDSGVWLPDLEYQKGNYTTHSGSLWCAQGRTRSRPGSDSSWRLQFKQGAFSK
jgi:hypothetical protein